MSDQLTLFHDTKREQFEEFHHDNPQVYAALVRHARRLKASGVRRFGIDGLFAIVRYTEALRTQGDPEFLLNNNLKPMYAREIERRESDLRDFFSTRALKDSRHGGGIMRKYLETVLVLFVLASSVIVPTDLLLACEKRDAALEVTSAADPGTREPQIEAIIRDGLLWWLNRDGPGYSFTELWDDLNDASEHFHHGPSRGGAR